jgi:hypothetical protein
VFDAETVGVVTGGWCCVREDGVESLDGETVC